MNSILTVKLKIKQVTSRLKQYYKVTAIFKNKTMEEIL